MTGELMISLLKELWKYTDLIRNITVFQGRKAWILGPKAHWIVYVRPPKGVDIFTKHIESSTDKIYYGLYWSFETLQSKQNFNRSRMALQQFLEKLFYNDFVTPCAYSMFTFLNLFTLQ